MDPAAVNAANLASAVQALLVRQGTALEGSTLLALLGQDLDILFQALTPEGAKLQLPSGQTFTAQGELPYPEGTLLRARLLPAAPGETHLRLQLQEARPPAPSPLLAPLAQSEGQSLAARLAQEPPAPELAPLLRLLDLLADPRPGQARLPSFDRILTALQELPEPLQASLGRTLGAVGAVSNRELATSLLAMLEEAQRASTSQEVSGRLPRPDTAVPEAMEGKGLERLLEQVTARFQAEVPGRPLEHRDPLTTWVRHLLERADPEPGPSKGAVSQPRAEAQGRSPAQDALVPPKLLAALGPHAGPKADLPEAWEAWVRGSVQTLADPAASPREAPFHTLQAKEGTAYFELPLPWSQAGPLQLWVEGDAPEERRGGAEPTRRVLLGLRFSNLGETRLGMAQGPFGLQIRVWTERPEALEAQKERLKQDLEELGKAVDLRIYALTYGPDGTIPSLRSLVTGPSLSALG